MSQICIKLNQRDDLGRFKSTLSSEIRFWQKVDIDFVTGCWNWIAYRTQDGYGQFSNGKMIPSHRFAYELVNGTIPNGFVIDHLCRNRACVNPSHMQPVTNKENILRGKGLASQQIKRTHCPHGHEYSKENTYFSKKGSRNCRTCHSLKNKRRSSS